MSEPKIYQPNKTMAEIRANLPPLDAETGAGAAPFRLPIYRREGGMLHDSSGERIADVWGGSADWQTRRADLIVAAVNQNAALKARVAELEQQNSETRSKYENYDLTRRALSMAVDERLKAEAQRDKLLAPELIHYLRLKLAETSERIYVNDVDIVPSIKALIVAAEGEAKP